MGWYQCRVHGDRSLNLQRIFFLSLLKNCNHKRLGIYYLLSAFIFGISGTLVSVLMRIELYSSGNRIISPENQNFYNVSITLHGLLMIFFLVMPGLFGGFGNYFAPVFQGSPEVVYPRINNFSILILFPSYLLLILSLISEFILWTSLFINVYYRWLNRSNSWKCSSGSRITSYILCCCSFSFCSFFRSCNCYLLWNNLQWRKDSWQGTITFRLIYSVSLSFGFNICWYCSNLYPNAFPRI